MSGCSSRTSCGRSRSRSRSRTVPVVVAVSVAVVAAEEVVDIVPAAATTAAAIGSRT